jgi:hypothetical protein
MLVRRSERCWRLDAQTQDTMRLEKWMIHVMVHASYLCLLPFREGPPTLRVVVSSSQSMYQS